MQHVAVVDAVVVVLAVVDAVTAEDAVVDAVTAEDAVAVVDAACSDCSCSSFLTRRPPWCRVPLAVYYLISHSSVMLRNVPGPLLPPPRWPWRTAPAHRAA